MSTNPAVLFSRLQTIQQELHQSRPFRTRAQEASVSLLRTAELIRRHIGGVIEPAGITPQQYNVLRILRGAGERGLPTLDIAERMIEETPGITRLIDRLETKDLVIRRRCDTDRRQVFCRITARGEELLEALEAPLQAAEKAALGHLDRGELETLIALLDRTREGLHASLTQQRALKEGRAVRTTPTRRRHS